MVGKFIGGRGVRGGKCRRDWRQKKDGGKRLGWIETGDRARRGREKPPPRRVNWREMAGAHCFPRGADTRGPTGPLHFGSHGPVGDATLNVAVLLDRPSGPTSGQSFGRSFGVNCRFFLF